MPHFIEIGPLFAVIWIGRSPAEEALELLSCLQIQSANGRDDSPPAIGQLDCFRDESSVDSLGRPATGCVQSINQETPLCCTGPVFQKVADWVLKADLGLQVDGPRVVYGQN